MSERTVSVEDIKADYMRQKQRNAQLERQNAFLTARNDQLQAWKNRQNARRLELLEGKRETRRHAEKRNWWCGIMMGAWIAAMVRVAVWIAQMA